MSSYGKTNFVVFKNALTYTVTFRIVSTLTSHSSTDIMTLALCAMMVVAMVQTLDKPLERYADQSTDRILKPISSLAHFFVQTIASAGVNMMSNLIGTYISSMFARDTDTLYLIVTSVIAIVLVWVIGVSMHAL